jgi:hypothetical protein
MSSKGAKMKTTIPALSVGQEIPGITKTAFMKMEAIQRNVIHTDEYAKEFGMRGALIGGSTLLNYVLEMLYHFFGNSWFYHGRISSSFIGGGAINGDVLTAHGIVTAIEPDETGSRIFLDVWMENQEQKKILVGTASCIKEKDASSNHA